MIVAEAGRLDELDLGLVTDNAATDQLIFGRSSPILSMPGITVLWSDALGRSALPEFTADRFVYGNVVNVGYTLRHTREILLDRYYRCVEPLREAGSACYAENQAAVADASAALSACTAACPTGPGPDVDAVCGPAVADDAYWACAFDGALCNQECMRDNESICERQLEDACGEYGAIATGAEPALAAGDSVLVEFGVRDLLVYNREFLEQ